MKLSILILTIEKRKHKLSELLGKLDVQIGGGGSIIVDKHISMYSIRYGDNERIIEIVVNYDEIANIGEKRNALLKIANGEYVCFFDDDDEPSPNYIQTLLDAIETKPDCASLRGIMTTNGTNPEIFEHSLKYKAWRTTNNKIKYERYPNHLNCIKSQIAKQFKFPEINHGEDFQWSKAIHESGILKTEYYIDDILYYYKFVTNK
jgi:glycosyltransferase involved in cell wall biosynthesis